jgi:hypothetical protein
LATWSEATLTLLPSGKVLLAGGLGSIPELYDPSTGAWSRARDLTEPLFYYSSVTPLPSGQVLLTGGVANGASNLYAKTAVLYDPDTNTWAPTRPMATNRVFHTAVPLPSGKVLVAGGWTDGSKPVASAELYDPATGTWSPTGSMLQARQGHTATPLSSGKVLVAGGESSQGTHASAELYDPATGTWAPTGSMALPRASHQATPLPSGRVLVTGDNFEGFTQTELFEPSTGTWTSGGRMIATHGAHTATLLPWGSVLIAGGYNPDLPSAELFTLEARNQPPVARPLEVMATEDRALSVTLEGSDVFEDALTYTVLTQPEHGTLSGTAPHLLYTPHPDFHGEDAFTYRVGDGEYDSPPETAALTVSPVNDAPQARPLEVTTAQQTPVEVRLEGTDIDGDALTYTLVDPPRHGELLGTPPELTFVPHSGYGPDAFTYRVSDGQEESEVVTVSLQVTPLPGCGGCASTRTGASAWLALLALGVLRRLARPGSAPPPFIGP